MCTVVIVAALITINCPEPRPTAAQAADILRPNAWKPAVTEPERPRVVFMPAPTPPPIVERAAETESQRAIRMGIPGGWTPLEWAILHGGR